MKRRAYRFLRHFVLLILSSIGAAPWPMLEASCGDEQTQVQTDKLHRLLEPRPTLPSAEEVGQFEDALPQSLAVLQKGLTSRRDIVRRNAAYVVDGLGPKAQPLVNDLRIAYRREKKAINRVYFAMAFAGLAEGSEETLSLLRTAFEDDGNINTKTYIAGALVTIRDATKEKEAWQWLMDSLTDDLPNEANEVDVERHWDRRWAASMMFGRLGTRAWPALAAMKKLAESHNVPSYVKQRLNDDISKIKFAAE